MKRELGTLSRYTAGARINHWVNAIILILLAISGLALFHPALYFLTGLFGGGSNAAFLHPWLGIVLLVTFAGLFFRFWRYNIWERSDTQWMNKIRDVLAARDENLPEVGRYNAGQKLVFWIMTIAILLLFLSGLVLWQNPPWDASGLTIDQKRIAAVVHASAAVVIICVWIVHLYAAIWVKGTVSAMTKGIVTGGWAWKHHRKWLREEAAKGQK